MDQDVVQDVLESNSGNLMQSVMDIWQLKTEQPPDETSVFGEQHEDPSPLAPAYGQTNVEGEAGEHVANGNDRDVPGRLDHSFALLGDAGTDRIPAGMSPAPGQERS